MHSGSTDKKIMKNPFDLISLAKFHLHLERRISLRVNSNRDFSFYPKFYYEGLMLEIEDVSVTGACFKNFFDERLLEQFIELEIRWENNNFTCRYQVIEQNESILRLMHSDFNPKFSLKLDQALRPGQIGVLFRKTYVPEGELWKGPVDEKIEFPKSKEVFARLTVFDFSLDCTTDGKLLYAADFKNINAGVHKGQLVNGTNLEKVLFALENITSPTPSVQKLIGFVSAQLGESGDQTVTTFKAVS